MQKKECGQAVCFGYIEHSTLSLCVQRIKLRPGSLLRYNIKTAQRAAASCRKAEWGIERLRPDYFCLRAGRVPVWDPGLPFSLEEERTYSSAHS